VVGTVASAVRSTVLPRNAEVRLGRLATLIVRVIFEVRVGRNGSYERRDRVMAMLGPLALLLLLALWLLAIFGGFALLYLAGPARSVAGALELSGSSLFTLGTTTAKGLGPNVLTYAEAGIGLLLLALLITYLPSMYGAFSRRERGVGLLRVRAGDPPTAATMLIRYHNIDDVHMRLTGLWRSWEEWFVDLQESHTSFQILVFFRSPEPHQSWIVSAGVLLDAAALWVSSIEHPRDADAQLCLRAGFQALRQIAGAFGIRFEPDPRPDDPISLSRYEWEQALASLEEAGLPIVADREKAWRDFTGWRVNYDTVLLSLARLVEAPVAPWVSDRSPLGHPWGLRASLGFNRR
jgi:hypothetical protein